MAREKKRREGGKRGTIGSKERPEENADDLTLELPPDVESRLHQLSAQSGQKPEEYLIGLVREKPLVADADAENDLDATWDDYHVRFGQEPGPRAEEVLAGLLRSDQEIAAGQCLTLEELDAAIQAPRSGGAANGR